MADDWEKRLDRIEAKLDRLFDLVQANTAKLAVNTHHLDEHMRRTKNLEDQRDEDIERTDARFKPLEDSQKQWAFTGKLFVFGVPAIGALAALGNFLINYFRK